MYFGCRASALGEGQGRNPKHVVHVQIQQIRAESFVKPYAYLRLVTFNYGSVPEHAHETALELVSGADFGRFLHHFSSTTRLKGSRGQVRPEIGQKTKLKL